MEYTTKKYIIIDLQKVLDGEYIGKVKNSPRYKSGSKYIHFKLDENGGYKIINEFIINRFEIYKNGIIIMNRSTEENSEELLYDAKIRNYILFPFNSLDKVEKEYVKGDIRLKMEDEFARLVMFIDAEGKLFPRLYCTYDCEYYDINSDGSNINEIIDLIGKSAKKDGALLKRCKIVRNVN